MTSQYDDYNDYNNYDDDADFFDEATPEFSTWKRIDSVSDQLRRIALNFTPYRKALINQHGFKEGQFKIDSGITKQWDERHTVNLVSGEEKFCCGGGNITVYIEKRDVFAEEMGIGTSATARTEQPFGDGKIRVYKPEIEGALIAYPVGAVIPEHEIKEGMGYFNRDETGEAEKVLFDVLEFLEGLADTVEA